MKKRKDNGENTTPKKDPSALFSLAVWRRFAVHLLLLLPAVSLFLCGGDGRCQVWYKSSRTKPSGPGGKKSGSGNRLRG